MTRQGFDAVARARRLYPVGVIADALAALESEVSRLRAGISFEIDWAGENTTTEKRLTLLLDEEDA